MRYFLHSFLIIALSTIAPSWSEESAHNATKKTHWIHVDTSTKIPNLHDVSYPDGAALLKQVGKRITLIGERVPLWNGMEGIATKEPHFAVSIDPVKIPKTGHVEMTCLFTCYREHPSGFKCLTTETGGNWFLKRVQLRQSELNELLAPYDCGSLVSVTGTLCHVTVSTAGALPERYIPQTPTSHFFFSVDDVVIKPMKSDHK